VIVRNMEQTEGFSMPVKYTMVFQLTTAPTNLTRAIPHTGGWTESVWASVDTSQVQRAFDLLLTRRRTILPPQASIVGYRVQNYTIAGNKLIPGGARSGSLQNPGNSALACDLPQVSLDIKLFNPSRVAGSRYVIRGMPDTCMINGEYQPTSSFAGLVTQFANQFTNGIWIIIGRDRTQPAQRVVGLNGASVDVDALIPGVGAEDFIRFLRVYDDSGNPVKGVFRVTAAPVGLRYVVAPAPNRLLTGASGLVRKDAIGIAAITEWEVSRARVKKIGRPSQGYRGRRSKVRM
jgi:hypothetical protein